MIRNVSLCVAVTAVLGFGSLCSAQDLEEINSDVAQAYAIALSQLFDKSVANPQVKFEVDPSLASGLHNEHDGLLMVPIKGLKEGKIDPAVESQNGAGLCYLFMSPCYAPKLDGKAIDTDKLRRLKIKDQDGNDRETICLLITAKHVDGDDWRLYGFGVDGTPVINSQFGESTKNAASPLAMHTANPANKSASLVITLFNKYSASMQISLK